jgi:hypothetical protein
VKLFLRKMDVTYVPLDNGLRIQVLPNVTYLPQCQKHHFAAFIQDPSILVVWDDDPNHLLSRAEGIEDNLIGMVWNVDEDDNEKTSNAVPSKSASRTPSIRVKDVLSSPNSNTEESLAESPRKIVLIQPFLTAITLILILAAIGGGWRQIAMELKVDYGWIRLAFVVVVPLQIWLALVGFIMLYTSKSRLTFQVLHAGYCRLCGTDYGAN